jgi:hypothetical protein
MRSRFVPPDQVKDERHVFVQKPELKNLFSKDKDPVVHQAFAWIMNHGAVEETQRQLELEEAEPERPEQAA